MLQYLQQGRFTSDGQDRILRLRTDVDHITVYNNNHFVAAAGYTHFYFQRGMPNGQGYRWDPMNNEIIPAGQGFYLIDSTEQLFGPEVTVTNISGANPPRVTAAGHGLQTGDIVRLKNITGGQQLTEALYIVDVINANDFDLRRAEQLPGAIAAPGADAVVQKVFYDELFFPRARHISAITQANQAQITTTVPHGYNVGQRLKLHVPPVFGMNIRSANVTVTRVVNAEQFTVDLNTTALPAFAYALDGDVPFNPAVILPRGTDLPVTLNAGINQLSNAYENQGFIGVRLVGGADSPGGANGDVMYWVAGKSFRVENE